MFETQTIYYKMIDSERLNEELIPADGVITSLSQLTKEQFNDLMNNKHPSAKKYREYALREFKYRVESYKFLNEFFKELK